MAENPKSDARKKPGPKPGQAKGNAGKGRPAKSAALHKPTPKVEHKRDGGRELFLPNVQMARETVEKAAKGQADRTQLAAAKEILDRVFGRPAQTHIVQGNDDAPPVRFDSGALNKAPLSEVVAAAAALMKARRSEEK